MQDLHNVAPKGRVTIGWVLHSLETQSFGLLLVLLAVIAVVRGLCSLAGLLLVFCAAQMAVGRTRPFFPRWISERPLPGRQLDVIVPRLVTVLRITEKAVHQRWIMPPGMISRLVGFFALVLAIRLLVVPLPFSNVIPAIVIGVIAMAYLEEDGVFLCLGLLAGFTVIGVDAVIVADVVRTKLPLS